MMELVEKLFGTTDLYAVLKLKKSDGEKIDAAALKSAYLKAALATHPDKGEVEERETRTQKFQVVKKIYDILLDDDLRKSYDQTGEWPGDEKLSIDIESLARLNEDMIQDFKKIYIGSDEERSDLMKFYKEGNGDVFHVIDNLFFCNILDDEERVQKMIDELIKAGKMDKLGGEVDKKKRDQKIRKAKKEAAEAEEMRKQMNLGNGLESLQKAIMTKRKEADAAFVDNLEQKYGPQKNGKSKGSNGAAKKGRGRPKKQVETNDDDDDEPEEVDDENMEDEEEKVSKPKKNGNVTASAKSRGRPKKVKHSEVEDDDDDAPEEVDDDENMEDEEEKVSKPKKNGNVTASTKSRGRPKKVKHSDVEEDDDDVAEEPKSKKQKSEEKETVSKPSSKVDDAPVKRGRGRPKKIVK